ncbi:MAG: aspartate/glutamate racemase family protein [SAR324 cluster bacterium]|jgi:Asp/Glu/hydantoin racemase|nr:aspartate/glutamate racemase family protein [SAR324 cluster bacterium]|tara:strand:- start:157 stop:843 length:687 start_codon:yes stop_codon:yes gene_type:complete
MSIEKPQILVINPNSNEAVTEGMAKELKSFHFSDGPEIVCVSLTQGPFGIESQADVEFVKLPLRNMVSDHKDIDAFVIACYSDPGLQVCREATDRPVFGIQECGVLAAMAQGDRFGVIALHERSIRRHLLYLRQMGVMGRFAKERAANLSVEECASGKKTFDKLFTVAHQLRDEDQADTIILGCAGMASHRSSLESRIGIPVIDPVQAAVSMAMHTVISKNLEYPGFP